MISHQRYVSKELSHFVGKGKTEEEQYDLLVNKIIKPGWITYAPHDPSRPRTLSLDLSKPISTDQTLKYQVVCFCDIPESDLAIHVSKYSKFGLAFKKEFLIAKGACPVFYLANESPVSATTLFNPPDFEEMIKAANARGHVNRAEYFSTSVRAIIDILAALDAFCCDPNQRFFSGPPVADCKSRFGALLGLSDAQVSAVEAALKGNKQALTAVRIVSDFLLDGVFSFIKCFDANRTFDDNDNYYMEREWRIANNVNFSLGDVSRVFFPSGFATRFQADLPSYIGQVSFID